MSERLFHLAVAETKDEVLEQGSGVLERILLGLGIGGIDSCRVFGPNGGSFVGSKVASN